MMTPRESELVRYPAGMAVVFRTNSTRIYVKTGYLKQGIATSTPLVASAGYDLYIRSGGEWLYANSTVQRNPKKSLNLISDMDDAAKECLLYLPMYSELSSVEIGVDSGATIEKMENPFRSKIVIYGSSFTHGISVSRSGMSYPMQIERNTGLYFISLGVSGHAKMQPFFAEILAASDARAFVFDVFSNPTASLIEERLIPFITRLRESHPTTPLIFLQTIWREKENFDLKAREANTARREMAARMMPVAMEKFRDVYFVDVPDVTGTDHATSADGTHPSDLGYWRWAQAVQPEIVRILKLYGIE